MSASIHGRTGDRLILLAVLLLAFLWLAPLFWVFGLSFKPNLALQERTDVAFMFQAPFTVKNYLDILGTSSVFRWIGNSVVVSVGQTLLVLILASLAGYGFARTEFPGKRWVFAFVLA
ncbi:MAG TPA: hypothetical protein VF832_13065, partial [Longimicrobiales bacterium]